MEATQWTPKVGERVVFTYPLMGWQGAAGVVTAIENGAQVVIQFDHDESSMHVRPWHLQPEPQVAPEALPANLTFRERPAKFWLEEDIVQVDGTLYRVRGITHSPISRRIAFSLHPLAGGAAVTVSFMPGDYKLVARGS